MHCQESKTILGAYLDGEIELMRSVELEEHLAVCPECRRDLEAQRSLQGLLRNPGLRYAAPAGLRESIRASLSPARPAESKQVPPKAQTPPRHAGVLPWRSALRWGAVAALFVVLAGATLFWFRGQGEQKIAEQVVDNHIRSLMAGHLADVPTSDQHQVKPWFAGKVSFSPNVPDFADKGFALKGGRIDYMENQTVAALIYQRRAHIINVFVYPSSENRKPASEQLRGYNLVHWAGSGMEYWLVSDLNPAELQELAGLLRS